MSLKTSFYLSATAIVAIMILLWTAVLWLSQALAFAIVAMCGAYIGVLAAHATIRTLSTVQSLRLMGLPRFGLSGWRRRACNDTGALSEAPR